MKSKSGTMSHLLSELQAETQLVAVEVEGKTGGADKGINPRGGAFSTLSLPLPVRRCSVTITTCVYGGDALAVTVCRMPITVVTNHRNLKARAFKAEQQPRRNEDRSGRMQTAAELQ